MYISTLFCIEFRLCSLVYKRKNLCRKNWSRGTLDGKNLTFIVAAAILLLLLSLCLHLKGKLCLLSQIWVNCWFFSLLVGINMLEEIIPNFFLYITILVWLSWVDLWLFVKLRWKMGVNMCASSATVLEKNVLKCF